MPVYVYERADGSRFEQLQGIHEDPLSLCPETGMSCRKVMAPARMFIPRCERPEAEAANRKQKAWLNKPETQERIKRGELVPVDASARGEDGPESSASILERARAGVSLAVN